ncbi:oocyte zinc finger protein XlCOF7.1-like [Pseudophryne corroboree]|uniref:oocyte zinc finger protein XlCOF7.1-like n=1 Tax=Pseudophryne corroboree TaxID=495146 RepID=UPI003081C2E4
MDRSPTNERILHLTLEIVHLLTGEDYTVVKKTFLDHLTTISCASITVPPPQSQIHERHDDQKILELTNKIIQLPSGEEWEYIEEHRGLYKDVMMENHRTLTSLDGPSNRDTPERCPRPLYSQDCTEENHRNPQEDQDEFLTDNNAEYIEGEEETYFTDNMAKHTEEEEDTYVRGDQQCKEEEIPTAISTADGQRGRNTSEGHLTLFPDFKLEKNMTRDSAGENPITPIVHPVPHSADISFDPSNHEEFNINSDVSTHSSAPTDATVIPSSEFVKSVNNQSVCIRQKKHTYKKQYPCSECGKCFTKKSSLITHHRVHTGVKPFSCSECGKFFTQKSNLVTHQRCHTGEKPFSCSECGKCFTQISKVITHQRSHTGEKPFPCSECGKCLAHKSSLLAHLRIHTGEKPFSCPKCGKCFTAKSELAKHQRSHKGE